MAPIAVAVLAAAGCGLMLAGLTAGPGFPVQPPPTEPPASPPPEVPTLGADQPAPAHADRSRPRRLRVPDLGIDASVVGVNLSADDGSIQAPDLDSPHAAGWFEPGPAPGELGAAALVGHVDSRRSGAAVFYDVGALEPGAAIEVERTDGAVAEFDVDVVHTYPKDRFPYEAVFASTGYSTLRLITCGGDFDPTSRNYTHNVVVYATLSRIRGE